MNGDLAFKLVKLILEFLLALTNGLCGALRKRHEWRAAEDAEKNEKEAGIPLLRAYRGLPKNGALIKFLSEPGVKTLLQKTENYYMQDQQKEMHKIDVELFFVIDEKNNQVELTEKGIELITTSGEDAGFFIMPDVGTEIADIEKSDLISHSQRAQRWISPPSNLPLDSWL